MVYARQSHHKSEQDQIHGVDLSNMLKPALSRGHIKVIASTTWEDFRKSFEKDRALMRRFFRLAIDEPSLSD